MLLVDNVRLNPDLPDPPETARAAIAATWRHRERIEREAAALFDRLTLDLEAINLPQLASRVAEAATDERRHALLCRDIVDACARRGPPLPPLPVRPLRVGLPGLDRRHGTLYTSVAMGCITETLSCALLLAMRDGVEFTPVVAAVDEIAKDEVEHGRLGWAHLAAEAARGDVAWLAPHIAAMREAALTHEIAEHPVAEDLSAYGVLARATVDEVVDRTWAEVIVPGLTRAGVIVD